MNAIEVCNEVAPEIARKQSEATGFEVGRTSLKWRNPANAPDAWEREVLEGLEQAKAAGADVRTLEHYEVVSEDGRQVFRYMKAIPTGEVCLNCHGQKLDPAVAAKLDELYPEDMARGFALGDIRGAFTLTKPLE